MKRVAEWADLAAQAPPGYRLRIAERGIPVESVYGCERCGALVHSRDVAAHNDWHAP